MEKGGGDAAGSANNSSDFVRKLYKMLEDPSYEHIVRWGEGGESFVVLENEKFTKLILPKHFKHSNFASFVRQLNKYDFHKVRQSNEDPTPSPYGPNAWEFKHPEFQANKKHSLDNIRRKAPASRKPAANTEENFSAQQMDMVNGQLVATQQQLQQLSERYQELANGHMILLQQVVQLQKFVKNHDAVMHRVMGFLHGVDAQRRGTRSTGQFINGAPGMNAGIQGDGQQDDHPASPLQQAEQLLQEFSAENLQTRELEQMSQAYNLRSSSFTPPSDQHVPQIQGSESSANQVPYVLSNDLDNVVYPVGQTNGIDPIKSEHIHNIPYGLPPNGMLPVENMPDMVAETPSNNRKKSMIEPVWGPTKPRILLVEDDKVCARIGAKFLQSFECGVDIARDGLESVNKMNAEGNNFDLILMDIIMPHLDGVSATSLIREVRPDIPIIAMTSNIRADEIDLYFRYGMNDVLPKPFTKEGMLRALERHLPQFKKQTPFPSNAQVTHAGGFTPAHQPLNMNLAQLSTSQTLKDPNSPGKSPATASSWQSPIQLPNASPGGNPQGNFMQMMRDPGPYAMTPTHAQATFPAHQTPNQAMMAQARQQTQRRTLENMTDGSPPDDRHDKRQKLYAAGPSQVPQVPYQQ
ncbi:BRRG2, response regulator [Xylogone sp. PMI_703]|nr:BRRG2, response regulator [Xylogone sp. PMI_703]